MRSISNSISLTGGNPGTSSGNTSSNSCTTIIPRMPSSCAFVTVAVRRELVAPFFSEGFEKYEFRNSASPSSGKITSLLAQSSRTWWWDIQSMPMITSSPFKGKQIKFATNFLPWYVQGHSRHAVLVVRLSEAGIETIKSKGSLDTFKFSLLALPAMSGFLAPAFIATSALGTLQSLARCPGLLHFQHTETLSEQWLAKWPFFPHL